MESSLLYLAIVSLLFFLAFGIELAAGNRSTKFLKDIARFEHASAPRVSIVVAARNEEKNVEEALQSLLSQDYQNLEIIVVNDRSTDQTGEILDWLARGDPRLQIVHIAELSHGWLGKNHALYFGAQRASGELLLFTDADVVMHPVTVSKAVSYMTDGRLDHVAVLPEVKTPGILLEMFVGAFGIFFSLYARPWKAKDPKSAKFIGIGAFNLVRAQVYQAVGAHQAIAMRPDDDMKLGKLIKKHGYRQELLFGRELISVEWYSSLRELIDGLMKNAFAGVEYSVAAVIASSAALLLFYAWPFLAIFVTTGEARIINCTIVLVMVALCWDAARFSNSRPWFGLGFPFATLLFVYILWRSMLTTIFNDGINWRGTHYSLAELKANKV